MTEQPEGAVDHVTGAGRDLGAATKAGKMMADVAVVLLDREGQVLAREELLGRDQPLEPFPIISHDDVAVDADLVEKSPTGRVITPTQLPGQGSPCHRIKGPPDPNLVGSSRDPGCWDRGSGDEHPDKRREEGLPAAPGVVDDLEEGEIGGQLLLRDAPVRPRPGA